MSKQRSRYDIVIIGGGIHGVGVAQAAAAAGYSSLLLEKDHLAAGTSSRSSKLIHGGLRYLESFHFSLVREALAERRLLLQNAPSLVRMLPFYLPVYRGQSRSFFKIGAGLSCYALLGGLRRETGFRLVPRRQWPHLDGIATKDLVAVFAYQEAQTDDAMLTKAVMQSARTLGAHLFCPADCTCLEDMGDHMNVRFTMNSCHQTVKATVVVNAAGPWINTVLARSSPPVSLPGIDLVQGAHIVLGGRLQKGAYFIEHQDDRRMVLFMPWKGNILVGTTETLLQDVPELIQPLPEETAYLRKGVAHYFPFLASDVQKNFAGIRVMPVGRETIFKRSRETVLHQDRRTPRVISIYGGKLTTYRATADKIMQRMARLLPVRQEKANTKKLTLSPV